VTIYIIKGANFIFKKPPLKNSTVEHTCYGEILWWAISEKFLKQCVSQDAIQRKDLWWFVGPIDDL